MKKRELRVVPKFELSVLCARVSFLLFVLSPFLCFGGAVLLFVPNSVFVGIFLLLSVLCLASFLFYRAQKYIYKNTAYTIGSEGVKIEARFINHTQHYIKYESINEVALNRGPFQRRAGLGTVVIRTRATSNSPEGGSGSELKDLELAEEVLEILKDRAH